MPGRPLPEPRRVTNRALSDTGTWLGGPGLGSDPCRVSKQHGRVGHLLRPERARLHVRGTDSAAGGNRKVPAVPRTTPLAPEALFSAVAAASLAAVLAWLGPPGSDLAAHAYQRAVFLQHGFALWNNFWYAGRYS